MKIILAKTAGCCMGVNRALDIALNAVEECERKPIYTHGPLIHNPQVVKQLEDEGVKSIEGNEDISEGTVIIRAHGVTPKKRVELYSKGLNVLDATCPHVKKLQSICESEAQKNRQVIIVGDRGHAEVIGLLGYIEGHGKVINTMEEVDEIDAGAKISVVAQTTQNRELFDTIVEKIKSKFSDVAIFTTICDATYIRQKECRELSDEVDLMLVIGGKNSANTVRLANISKETGTRTEHIETEDEIQEEWLQGVEKIGVTAGASTPDWIINKILDRLKSIDIPE